MARALLMVMDSVGCGGAPDAADFGDEGANTLGHIIAACAGGQAEEGRTGPLRVPVLAVARARAGDPRRLGGGDAGHSRARGGGLGGGDRGLARQGHALGALGACRRAGAVGLALLPAHRPGDPRGGHGAADRARRPAGDALQRPFLGDAGAARLRRRAHPRPASRSSTPRPTACCRSPRTRQHFGLDRLYEVCRIAAEIVHPLRVGRVIARPFVGETPETFVRTAEPPRPRHRRRPSRRSSTGWSRPAGAPMPSARSATSSPTAASRRSPRATTTWRSSTRRSRRWTRPGTATSSSPTTSTSTPSGATRATSPAMPARSRPSTRGCPRCWRGCGRAT